MTSPPEDLLQAAKDQVVRVLSRFDVRSCASVMETLESMKGIADTAFHLAARRAFCSQSGDAF
jgi:hypothetical protein